MPSEILEVSPKSKVQCPVITVSPETKRSRDTSYFDGEISDSKSSLHVYGFHHTNNRPQLRMFVYSPGPTGNTIACVQCT